MPAPLRSLLIRRTLLAGTVLTLATAGAGAAYVHVAAAPTPGSAASGSAAKGVKDGLHPHRHGGRHLLRTLIRDTAKETNQTPAQVLTQLKAGRTLNEVAGGRAGAVKADAVAAARTRLDRAVSRGRLDAAREKTLLDTLGSRIDTLMTKNLATELQRVGRPHGTAKPPAAAPAAGAPAQA